MRTNSASYLLPVSILLTVGTLALLSISSLIISLSRPSEAGYTLLSDDKEDERRLRKMRLRLALKPLSDRVCICL